MASARPSPPQQHPEARDPLPGMVVNGKFRVVGVLAHGGMGKIYHAEQVPLGRPVALKVLRSRYADEVADDPNFQKRFFLEASILAKLQHTNIVTLYDYGRIEGVDGEQYFMAMEMLRGDTLAKRIKTIGALHPVDGLRLVRQIAKGLLAAHKLEIVHRDLKPSNVMLVPEDEGGEVVKILDFGIGKVLKADTEDLTAEGAFVGSPRYMAPEQIHDGRIDTRTDIYALGVIMYECFTGRVPFEGETNIATMMAHCNMPVPPMRERAPGVIVPARIERMVMHLLAKSPDARPQTMEEVLRTISACEVEVIGTTSGMTSAPFSSGKPIAPEVMSSGELPTVAGMTPQPAPISSPTGGGRISHPTGTHRSLTRSWMPSGAPEPAASSRKTGAMVVVAVAAIAVVAVVATFFVVRAGQKPDAAAAASTTTTSIAPPPARATFSLAIESQPEGAQVFEGEGATPLGTTPMQLPIDKAQARTAPKKFVLRLDGFAPYTVLQADSETDVRVIAQLVSAPAASADPAPSATATSKPAPHAGPSPAPKPAPAPAPQPHPDLDIKLKR